MQSPENEDDALWDADREEHEEEHGEAHPANSDTTNAHGKPRRPTMQLIKSAWKPEPIEEPTIDPNLPGMPWPERCAETIRYACLDAEHWISPQGFLREWIRINLWLSIGFLATALLVVPPITMLMEGVARCSSLVHATISSITATVMVLPPIVIAIGAVLIGYRLLRRQWLTRRHRRGYRDPDDPYN